MIFLSQLLTVRAQLLLGCVFYHNEKKDIFLVGIVGLRPANLAVRKLTEDSRTMTFKATLNYVVMSVITKKIKMGDSIAIT